MPVKVRLSIENRRVSWGNLVRPITLQQRRSRLRCRCDAGTASQEALGVGHEDGTSCWCCCQLVSHLLPYPHTFRSGLGPNLHETYESDTSLLKPSRDPSFRTSDKSNGSPFSLHALSQPLLLPKPTSHPLQSSTIGWAKKPRSRVISTASMQSTFTHASTRPVSVIRGAPHSALSNIQIVLPAPLAPQLQNYVVTISSVAGMFSNSKLDISTQDIPCS